MDITKLKGHIPDSVLAEIPLLTKFEIDTNLRLCHFLAQCQHESMNFRAKKENLNYGAKGLRSVFPKYFPTDGEAMAYERKPEAIANKVYANRMGNGDEKSGDGYKYCGRGFIQLTGKNNYAEFSKDIGEDCVTNPDLVSNKYPLASAAWFFWKNKINEVAGKGADEATVTLVTKRVNGGTIGLADRIKHFNYLYNLIK